MTKVLLVTQPRRFAGGMSTVAEYIRSAKHLGHEVALFGEKSREFAGLEYSLDAERFDFAVFVVNEATDFPDLPHLARLLDGIPRARRIVIDCSGRYNDTVRVDGDVNHLEEVDGHEGWEWMESFQALSDTILQPALTSARADVRPFLFHGYDSMSEQPLEFRAKAYGLVYVGGNWFRWRALRRVLEAVEPIRSTVGRMMIAGEGWRDMPSWLDRPLRDEACFTDYEYLRDLRIELRPHVPFDKVVPTMSLGVLNPVLVRPVFRHLRMVTPRLFETVAAGTIPLFDLDADYVAEIYGPAAVPLVLGEDGSEQIIDILRRPSYYAEIVREMRRHLAERHTFEVRVQELMDICEQAGASA